MSLLKSYVRAIGTLLSINQSSSIIMFIALQAMSGAVLIPMGFGWLGMMQFSVCLVALWGLIHEFSLLARLSPADDPQRDYFGQIKRSSDLSPLPAAWEGFCVSLEAQRLKAKMERDYRLRLVLFTSAFLALPIVALSIALTADGDVLGPILKEGITWTLAISQSITMLATSSWVRDYSILLNSCVLHRWAELSAQTV